MVQWFSFTAKTTKNDWDVSAIHIWNSILLPICPSPFPTNLFSSSSPSQQHLTSLNSYELHFSKLTLALSKMEGTVRQEQEEKVFKGAHLATVVTLHTHTHTLTHKHTQQKALLADVAATRELCLQLDKTKESLSRQLASQAISYEQVQGQLEDLRLERDLLKQQV